MRLLKIFPIVLILFLLPVKTFADAPDISYGRSEVNLLTGYYHLMDNVRLAVDNHGVKLILTADDAKINIKEKNCLATGKVTLTHDEILFTCDKAFARWENESADIVGKINFKSKGNVIITADTATFNWKEKIADFYGKVKIKPDKNFKVDKNLKLGKGAYAHVRYNVVENKILQLDKNFKDPKITVPDFQ